MSVRKQLTHVALSGEQTPYRHNARIGKDTWAPATSPNADTVISAYGSFQRLFLMVIFNNNFYERKKIARKEPLL